MRKITSKQLVKRKSQLSLPCFGHLRVSKQNLFFLLITLLLAACNQVQDIDESVNDVNNHPNTQQPNELKKINGREEVALDKLQNSTVVFTFGQSNAANHGAGLYTPHNEVYNYYAGHLYKAKDPLLGATGDEGSVWGRLADKMIDAGMTKKVSIISIGYGGSDIASWVKGGAHYQMFINTLDQLVANHVKIDYFLWHQGETDNINKLPKAEYIRRFEMIRAEIRNRNINAPILVAIASYHPQCLATNNGLSLDIRGAQVELAKRYADIFQGPDTDTLINGYRREDGVHFSARGLDEHANLWLNALKDVKNLNIQ